MKGKDVAEKDGNTRDKELEAPRQHHLVSATGGAYEETACA
jgi:hypothetical protein